MTVTGRMGVAMLAAALGAFGAAGAALGAEAAAGSRLEELLNRMPDVPDNSRFHGPPLAEAVRVYDEVLKGGRAQIVALVDRLIEPGHGRNFKPRYVLHGMAQYLGAPRLERERRLFAEALASTLDGPRPNAVKGFVVRQLQVVGGEEVVPAVGRLLLDPDGDLCECAAQALVAIGGPKASAEVRSALPRAGGRNRLTLVQAAGALRDAGSAGECLKALRDAERDVRVAAGYALAGIGDPAAADPLLKAAEADAPFERGSLGAACLLLGRRLIETDRRPQAERLLRALWTTRTGADDLHVRSAALEGLGLVGSDEAIETIAEAARGDDAVLAAAAVDAAAVVPSEPAALAFLERFRDIPPDRRARFVSRRAFDRGPGAKAVVLAALRDADNGVRGAAIASGGRLGGRDLVAALLERMDGPDAGAAGAALRTVPGGEADAQIAAALPKAAPAARQELLSVLAARVAVDQLPAVLAAAADQDAAVRAAAIRAVGALGSDADVPRLIGWITAPGEADLGPAADALAAIAGRARSKDRVADQIVLAIGTAAPSARAVLVSALVHVPAPAALAAVRAAVKDGDAGVRDAAVRGLADWPNAAPADDLLAIAARRDDPTHPVLALRGYVRMVHLDPSRPLDERFRMCEKAFGAAARPDEKKLVLGALGQVPTMEALTLAARQTGDPALAEEAGAVAVALAERVQGDKAAIRAAMEKVLAACKETRTVERARQVLGRLGR